MNGTNNIYLIINKEYTKSKYRLYYINEENKFKHKHILKQMLLSG